MELDELKKSWKVLDEHLKEKRLVKDEDISRLIGHTTHNLNAMSRMNKRLRIIAFIILILVALFFIYNGAFPDTYYTIIYIAAIPALAWDLFCSSYLTNTKIDELSLSTVISRFNRIHRWVIRERIIGIAFILLMAAFFFIDKEIWRYGTSMIVFFVLIWSACLLLPLWIYRKNLGRLREIKKNLNELKELKA